MNSRVGKCLLADLLKKSDLTQQQLAEMVNIPKQQINKYVNDHQMMSYKTARKISKVIGCQMEELYEWESKGKGQW